MVTAFAELPLALFTTLAPVGAGAFLVLAFAFCSGALKGEVLRKADRLTAIPLAVTLVGFMAAFAHLASPLNALYVMVGIGRSPLTNEIVVGGAFLALAVVYWLLSLKDVLSGGSRKAFAIVIAALGVLFSAFIGAAYGMPTIASWCSPLASLEVVASSLLGGSLLGMLVIALSGAEETDLKAVKTEALVLAAFGFALGVGSLIGHAEMVSALSNGFGIVGTALVAETVPFLWGAALLGALALFCQVFAMVKKANVGVLAVGVACAVIAGFLGRLCFYAMFMSVGL